MGGARGLGKHLYLNDYHQGSMKFVPVSRVALGQGRKRKESLQLHLWNYLHQKSMRNADWRR